MTSRIVRDFLERRSRVLLLGSALYLVVSLLVYSLVDPDGFGSFFPFSGMLLVCVFLSVLDIELQGGLTRFLLHRPIDRRALAKTYCALAVGVPSAWVLGLTLIAWLAVSLGGGVGWISVPMAVAWAFLASSLYFCLVALLNLGRAFGGECPPRSAQVAIWALIVMAWLAGEYIVFGSFIGSIYYLLSPDSWQPKHLLVVLALGAAASTLGFARTHSLLSARRTRPKSRLAAPRPAILSRLPLARNLTGFAAITASCLWMPIAIVGALGALLAIYFWTPPLLGLSDSRPLMDLSDAVIVGGVFPGFLVYGFTTTVPRFANFRVLKSLPLSTRRLGACVTLLPAILVLVQVALAFPLLYALDSIAATNLFLPLVGAVGIGALLCPALLVRPQADFASLVVIVVLQSVWLTLVARAPALQVLAPLVLAGGLFASWSLSTLVFRHALVATEKQPPLQWVSPRGNN